METIIRNVFKALVLTILVAVAGSQSWGANRYAVANGNWNSTNTWAETSGGNAGVSVPVAGDDVYVGETNNARTVTIPSGYQAVCASLTVGTAANGLAQSLKWTDNTSTLTISGNLTMMGPSTGTARDLLVNAGTLTVNGNMELSNGQTNGTIANRICRISVTTGTVNVGGNLYFYNQSGSTVAGQNQIVFNGAGTFNLAGAFTYSGSAPLAGTLTASASAFNFNGSSAQSIPVGVSAIRYNNLNINNAAGATLSAAITATNVTGNLSVQSGTLNNGGYAIALASGKSLSVSGGATFNLTGTSTMVTVSGGGTKTFAVLSNTNYSGGDQTVTAETYGNLSLSGGAAKTMPGTPMTVAGNFSISESGTTATAGAAVTTSGSFTVGSGATFSAGTYAHSVAGSWSNSGTFNPGSSTVTFNGSSAATIGGSSATSFNNLTISNAAGITGNSNISVSGILSLGSNASSTMGCLDMSYTNETTYKQLTMAAAATTTGTGDVTGVVTRTSFAASTPYSFGSQFTTMNMSSGGTLPSSVSVLLVLTTAHTWKSDAIHRYYNIIQTGGTSGTIVTMNLHYLATELNGTTEGNLHLFDYHGESTVHDHGRSNFSTTDKWYGLANLTLTYIAPVAAFGTGQKFWTLGTSTTAAKVWLGVTSTAWTLPENWTVGVPGSGDDVIIPDASTTNYDPLLSTTTINSITIQTGGIMNGGTSQVLTLNGGTGAWLNLGTFNSGTSTVQFTNASATLADVPPPYTIFYNIEVANGAKLTLGSSTYVGISNAINLNSSGVLDAASNECTVEYNGSSAQVVVNPNAATPGYHNLVLSGAGSKTMPGNTLYIRGDFTNNYGSSFSVSDVVFNGPYNMLQNMNGTYATSFGIMTLNNPYGIALANSDIAVSSSLVLTSGIIATGSQKVTLGASASVSGASATNYISGKLARDFSGTGSKTFPVGKGGNYRPVTFNYSALTGTSTVTVEQFETVIPASAPAQTTLLGSRYWTISESGGSGHSYDVTLDGTGFSPNRTVKMIRGNGTTNLAYAVTGSYTNSVAFTDFSSTNFTLGQSTAKTTANDGSWFTAATWSPAEVPLLSDDLTVNHAVAVDNTPVAVCNDLQISSGSLTISPGYSLTVNGALSNATATKLVIGSNASGTGSLIHSTVSVPATVERYIDPSSWDWHFLSSPVAAQAIWPNFAPAPAWGAGPSWNWDVYYWNPIVPNQYPSKPWVNIRASDGSYNSGGIDLATPQVNGMNTGADAGFGTTSPPTFTVGRGYMVSYGTGYGSSTHQFQGNLNTGPQSVTLSAAGSRWHLVGNPFPSSLNWMDADWGSATSDRSSLYSTSGFDYWILDDSPTGGNYLVFNSGGTGDFGVSGDIAPGQAFWVYGGASGGTFKMGNDVRSHSSQAWLKKSSASESNILRFRMTTDRNSYHDQFIVDFNPIYPGDEGSFKLGSLYPEAPELWSVKNSNRYSIDRYREATDGLTVSLAAKTGVEGTYTVTATNIADFALSEQVILKDLKLGTSQDLKKNAVYTFAGGPADSVNRFLLVFKGPNAIAEDPAEREIYNIIFTGDNIVITPNGAVTGDAWVRIFDLAGKVVYSVNYGLSAPLRIPSGQFAPGVYVVKVTAGSAAVTGKVMVY